MINDTLKRKIKPKEQNAKKKIILDEENLLVEFRLFLLVFIIFKFELLFNNLLFFCG